MPLPRSPAPGRLRLVQEFVNTWDIEAGIDELAEPPALQAWTVERSLLPPGYPVDDADVAAALRVREALRSLLEANAGAAPDPAAVEILN
ncbi:MAG: ABATE domain-containing protein, partial [Actinomycetota bacterium]|nr:ABATE domain-containing protein [Actinomycetota bacterium]